MKQSINDLRRLIVSAFMGTLLLSFSAAVLMAQEGEEPPPVNINGGFENTATGVVTDLSSIEGWFLELLSGATADFEVVDDPVFEGNRALRVLVNNHGSQAWHVQAVGDQIPVDPGATYRFSVRARAGAAGAQAAFTVGNYAFNEYGALRSNISIPTANWGEFSFEFTVTDNETSIRAPIHFGFASNVGIPIYLDDLKIVEISEAPARRFPVILTAADGEVGEDFDITEEGNITYVTVTTNANPGGTWLPYPISMDRVVAFDVTFPFAGEYDLFIRARVGPATFDDDSFFFPADFGDLDPAIEENWFISNGLVFAGFDEADEYVVGGGAAGGAGVWKWINVSKSDFHTQGITYTVEENNSTLRFLIGGRENGFDIHKIAFGRTDLFFSVGDLDNGRAGLPELPTDDLPPPHPGPPLATGKAKWVGNIYSPNQMTDFGNYWNQITPENATKWGSVEGTRDVMNWGGADFAYNYAKENGIPFRFHVLVWGNQQPGWMIGLPHEEQLAELREWFEAVAERYPDIDYLEVVNEPLHDPPTVQANDPSSGGYFEALGGSGETGWDWVINAFQMAREIFPPTTKLMINDYNIVSNLTNAMRYREIIRLLQERDLIDGIGVQGHAFSTRGSANNMRRVLDTLAVTGLPIQVTEMDIDGNPTASPNLTNEQSDQNQLNDIQRIFPVFYQHPAVEGITFWGWRPGLWRQDQQAFLVRTNGAERPAMLWLRNYMAEQVSIEQEINLDQPKDIRLSQNYPNPFNPTTRINYEIPESGMVNLEVYDLMGRKVATLVNEMRSPGHYSVYFNAANLASGVYIYRLTIGNVTESRRMTLIK